MHRHGRRLLSAAASLGLALLHLQSATAQQPRLYDDSNTVELASESQSRGTRLPAVADPRFMPSSYSAASLDDLRRSLAETQAELEQVKAQQASLQSPAPKKSVEDRLSAVEKAVAPKMPLIKLGGFFQLDTAYFNQDLNSRASLGDIQDGTSFRRTRLQAYGSVSEFTNYIIEMDFAQAGRPSFFDVWGEQTNLPWFGTVRIGNFRQPNTMDGLTSVRHLEFMERSLPFNAFDPFRRVGIMSYNTTEDKNTTWAYSVFRPTGSFFNNATAVPTTENFVTLGDTRFGNFYGDNGGYGFALRATHLLWYDEPAEGRYLLHVGGHFNYNAIGADAQGNKFYRARTFPEVFIGDPTAGFNVTSSVPAIVDTGTIAANSFEFWGAELAGQYGAAHFQTEYMITSVNQVGGPALFYDGAYAQAGYFLTGENCGYNRTSGVLDYNVKPFSEFYTLRRPASVCGWGAWEIAARWSYVNLNNMNAVLLPATIGAAPNSLFAAGNPGTANDFTVALNWWWNQYTRVQFNYVNVQLDNRAHGDSTTHVFAARYQIEF